MKILQVHSVAEDGSKKLDMNLIVELGIKLLAVVAAIIAMRATNQANQNAQKIQTQQHFLNVDRGSNYVATVERSNAANQRRK